MKLNWVESIDLFIATGNKGQWFVVPYHTTASIINGMPEALWTIFFQQSSEISNYGAFSSLDAAKAIAQERENRMNF